MDRRDHPPEMDTVPPQYLGEVRKRRWVKAVLLNVAAPGLGYLYCGRPFWALALGLATLLPLVALLVSGWVLGLFLLKPVGLTVMLLLYLHIGMAFDLRRLCRGADYVLKPFNHSAVYGAIILFGVVAPLLVSANLISVRVLGTLTVPDLGMYPKLAPGDQVYFERRDANTDWPLAGDVVVAQLAGESAPRVLRVMALPGQSVALRGSTVLVDGEALPTTRYAGVRLDESLATAGDGRPLVALTEFGRDESHYSIFQVSRQKSRRDTYGPDVLAEDEYFLLGDYRDAPQATDSRNTGPVKRKSILGLPRHVWWSRSASGTRWERIGLRIHSAPFQPIEDAN